MHLTRRAIVGGAAAVAALANEPAAWAQAGPWPQRKRIYGNVRPAELADYKLAIEKMLALPVTDARNWYRQAVIHIIDCAHFNWWFLPWHRGYLSSFERICGELIGKPDFRVPYWDWTDKASVPEAFYDLGLDSGKAPFLQDSAAIMPVLTPGIEAWFNGLDAARKADLALGGLRSAQDVLGKVGAHLVSGHGPRGPRMPSPNLAGGSPVSVAKDNMSFILGKRPFFDFAGRETTGHHAGQGIVPVIESGPHGNVHVDTGGFMGRFMSPVDPVFYLHHANLDRIWDIWSRKQLANNRADLPEDPAEKANLLKDPFLFFPDPKGAPVARTAGDCMSLNALGYRYEPGSMENEAAAPTRPSRPARVLAKSADGLSSELRSGFETFVSMKLTDGPLKSVVESGDADIVANITLTPPPDAENVTVGVFINCPDLSRYTATQEREHFVGTLTFFGAAHHAGHDGGAPQPITQQLLLSPTLRRLNGGNQLPVSQIKLQLMPDAPDDKGIDIGGALQNVQIEIS